MWTWHGEVLDLPYVSETECQYSHIYYENCRYINQLVYSIRNPDIYGFLEPQSIQKYGNKKMDCQTYIQR